MRPVLMAGNSVSVELRARVSGQLPSMTVELIESRGPLLGEPLPAAAIAWLTVLTAAGLPEEQPFPRLYEAHLATLNVIAAAQSARGWATSLVRYEVMLLSDLGFGLDLGACAVLPDDRDLGYVSPRSGRAVSRLAAQGYESRLLALPAFLTSGGEGDWPSIFDGMALTGHFLERALFHDQRRMILDARERLVDQLKRAVA